MIKIKDKMLGKANKIEKQKSLRKISKVEYYIC